MKASDYNLERDIMLSIPSGRVPYASSVNKFGYAPSGVQATETDIWDRADATPTQQLWLKPYIARLHNIKSTSILDDDGVGISSAARTIRVFGLVAWDKDEVFEDIILDGTTNVSTVNEYVIIHRMYVLTYGINGKVNAGILTATVNASGQPDDGQVTAQINIDEGQTQMAIFGIPSTKTAYLTNWYASMQKASGSAADVTFKLRWCAFPDYLIALYGTKETRGLESDGSSEGIWHKQPYTKFEGPGILKITGLATSSTDIDGSAGFDLILLDN